MNMEKKRELTDALCRMIAEVLSQECKKAYDDKYNAYLEYAGLLEEPTSFGLACRVVHFDEYYKRLKRSFRVVKSNIDDISSKTLRKIERYYVEFLEKLGLEAEQFET